MIDRILPEFIGTFVISFITLQILDHDNSNPKNAAMAIFFTYAGLVYSFKNVCYAYFNPILTLGNMLMKKYEYL